MRFNLVQGRCTIRIRNLKLEISLTHSICNITKVKRGDINVKADSGGLIPMFAKVTEM